MKPTVIRRVIDTIPDLTGPNGHLREPSHRYTPRHPWTHNSICDVCGLARVYCAGNYWPTPVPRWQRIIVWTALTLAALIVAWYIVGMFT